jgi:hypothetical protein
MVVSMHQFRGVMGNGRYTQLRMHMHFLTVRAGDRFAREPLPRAVTCLLLT